MSLHVKKGDWMQIVLEPGQRPSQVPGDTSKVPLVKGFLTSDAKLGYKVTITTVIGREITGELVAETRSSREFVEKTYW